MENNLTLADAIAEAEQTNAEPLVGTGDVSEVTAKLPELTPEELAAQEEEKNKQAEYQAVLLKQIKTMFKMQDELNKKVHQDWVSLNRNWVRALWKEAAEILDHIPWKWWKKGEIDLPQAQMELVDMFHFGISDIIVGTESPGELIGIQYEMANGNSIVNKAIAEFNTDVEEKTTLQEVNDLRLRQTENFIAETLLKNCFPFLTFNNLMVVFGLSPEELYRQYIGKNVLNGFRQERGYKEGTYKKEWFGKEDNVHLVEIMDSLDIASDTFPEDVKAALKDKYESWLEALLDQAADSQS